jgi:hypothetical protein
MIKPKISVEFIERGQKYQHRIFRFDNGYGASLACSQRTYGGDDGLWELAVITFVDVDDNHDFGIVYNTPINNDVIGWLTYSKAMKIVRNVERLPKYVYTRHDHECGWSGELIDGKRTWMRDDNHDS